MKHHFRRNRRLHDFAYYLSVGAFIASLFNPSLGEQFFVRVLIGLFLAVVTYFVASTLLIALFGEKR